MKEPEWIVLLGIGLKIPSADHTYLVCGHTVCPCLGPSVSLSVGLLVAWLVNQFVPHLLFWRFAIGFCITAPAPSHMTNAIVYTAIE